MGRFFPLLLERIGVIKYSDDIAEVVSHRTEAMWKEGIVRGITMQQLSILGKKRDESRALLPQKKGSLRRSWEYFQSLPIPYWKMSSENTWVDDKATFKKVFRKNHLPIAEGRSVFTLGQALRTFRSIGKEVIVKPREGSRGRHTTVRITDEEEFIAAFKRAKQLCPFVMVEEYIPGTLYRATCVDGKVIGIMDLVQPIITTDGQKTVEELRLLYNSDGKKFAHLTDVKDDAWFHEAITHQGYTPRSIPPAGVRLVLAEHSERTNGGYFIDITDEVPARTIAEIERAARACQIMIIGFDILSIDLRKEDESFTFIEGNSLPYIEIHHIPYEGKVRNVAGAIWDMWFEKANSSGS